MPGSPGQGSAATFFFSMFIFEREREREHAGEEQGERGTENLKQVVKQVLH